MWTPSALSLRRTDNFLRLAGIGSERGAPYGPAMQISDSTAVVTGAGRGLGRHLVDALLDRGAAKVYGLARDPSTVRADPRVVPLPFDLLDPASIQAAAAAAADASVLVNNASTAAFATPLDADPEAVRREMAVNYEGTFAVIRAFVPVLEARGGHVVNVLSLLSLASTPPMAGYSASKAAAHSLTQALRPILRRRGITVHGVYPAGIDTDMLAGIDAPKTPPSEVAAGILDGLAADQEDIFPDPNAKAMSQTWWRDPKAFEQAFAAA
jgi:NAD(P)-dependent dehydrogenase (short-subunit alcohol dehydrogenase family)